MNAANNTWVPLGEPDCSQVWQIRAQQYQFKKFSIFEQNFKKKLLRHFFRFHWLFCSRFRVTLEKPDYGQTWHQLNVSNWVSNFSILKENYHDESLRPFLLVQMATPWNLSEIFLSPELEFFEINYWDSLEFRFGMLQNSILGCFSNPFWVFQKRILNFAEPNFKIVQNTILGFSRIPSFNVQLWNSPEFLFFISWILNRNSLETISEILWFWDACRILL